ncbi:MAG: hypothetical protein A2Z57_00365 [Planctomycetes bacterium RIFCSPHIGHO2_12_39_6]|nr:MAG: hypothetical protein A2Z57_00365 [Planctomycetes bacterium RIFCSPHIGHO2_12_39_6]
MRRKHNPLFPPFLRGINSEKRETERSKYAECKEILPWIFRRATFSCYKYATFLCAGKKGFKRFSQTIVIKRI